MSKADELRLLRDAIKSFPDAVAVLSADGRWLRRTLRRLDGGGSVELIAEVTELRRAEQASRFLAYHDQLTGLPNRRLLDDRLRQAIRLAERRDRMVAALLVHLDDFRQINDALGHDAGDALLRNADAATFRAKQLGRNQIRFFARAG